LSRKANASARQRDVRMPDVASGVIGPSGPNISHRDRSPVGAEARSDSRAPSAHDPGCALAQTDKIDRLVKLYGW